MALDVAREEDEVFEQGDVQVLVDRASYFFIDEPLKIDFDPEEGVYRIKAATHVIPDKIRL